jgi:hypothetical protein
MQEAAARSTPAACTGFRDEVRCDDVGAAASLLRQASHAPQAIARRRGALPARLSGNRSQSCLALSYPVTESRSSGGLQDRPRAPESIAPCWAACTVVRDDEGHLLAELLVATIITVAAPNAKALRVRSPEDLPLNASTFLWRVEYVLTVFASDGWPVLVLRAWGCSVFGNDPALVARAFATHLGRGFWTRLRRKARSGHSSARLVSTPLDSGDLETGCQTREDSREVVEQAVDVIVNSTSVVRAARFHRELPTRRRPAESPV